jgi:hypothetical protein
MTECDAFIREGHIMLVYESRGETSHASEGKWK